MKEYKENDREILVSESVGKGHPDKICDQISDAMVDACLKEDINSRVACETMACNHLIVVAGEITTNAKIDVNNVVWTVLKPLGYREGDFTILSNINKQSSDIAKKVNKENEQYGAGDQGITYGYATNETKEFLPIQYVLSTQILQTLEKLRVKHAYDNESIFHLMKADMKSQVELCKVGGVLYINQIILAIQHVAFADDEQREEFSDAIKKVVVGKIREITKDFLNFKLEPDELLKTKIRVNASGDFVIGGPIGDTGLTGRKLQVDTYGAAVRHGGGALSGKDYTKVDRTGAYMARWIAKNVVYNKLADQCEIGLSWEIGATEPDDLIIECFGTNKVPLAKIREMIYKNFNDLNLTKNIRALRLQHINYLPTATYGHFTDQTYPWEKTFKFIA